MRILFIGDVVGSLGRDMISTYLPLLKQKHKPNVTIVNGENAASGRGITEKIYKKFMTDGAQMITMGNHTWDNRDILDLSMRLNASFVRLTSLKEHPVKDLPMCATTTLRLRLLIYKAGLF